MRINDLVTYSIHSGFAFAYGGVTSVVVDHCLH